MEQRVNNIFVETIVADQIHTISETDQLYLPMKVIVGRTEYTYPEFSAKYAPHIFPETQEVFVGVLYSVFKNEAVNTCKGTALNGLVVNLCPMYR